VIGGPDSWLYNVMSEGGGARPRQSQVSGGPVPRVRFSGASGHGTHGRTMAAASLSANMPANVPALFQGWPFKTASPTRITGLATALLEGSRDHPSASRARILPHSTSCDGAVSLELGLALSLRLRPAALESALRWHCIRPLILCLFFSTITSTLGGWRQGVKVSSSACRYREPPSCLAAAGLDWNLPPDPVESRTAAVDNPHVILRTRPGPRYLSSGFRLLVSTCAYCVALSRTALGTVARPPRPHRPRDHEFSNTPTSTNCVSLAEANPTITNRPISCPHATSQRARWLTVLRP
jgi:hypothetical protein